jgi:hypothetical protein
MKFYRKNQVMFSLMNEKTTKGEFHHRSRSVGGAGLGNLSLATDNEGARHLVE